MAEKRIQQTHKRYADFYRISGGFTLVILGIWLGSLLFTDGYATNVYTELLSVIATILVLDQINQWRDKENLKERLMNEVKSPAVGQATAALAWLRREEWIEKDTFKNSHLQNVNWANAYVGDLNLEQATLRGAILQHISNEIPDDDDDVTWQPVNLRKANLRLANLQSATLAQANLQEANLHSANLSEAYLREAQMQFANLRRASMQGTILTTVNLRGANLALAKLEDNKWQLLNGTGTAILPDGEAWTPATDMEKFTHPEHPDFAATLDKINTIRAEMGIDPIGIK